MAVEIIIPPKKKHVILDATILTTLMACPCLVDLRFNHKFQSINGKSNSLECGSLAHKILEVFYKEKIKGFDRKTAIASGLTAGLMYIQGCRFCADFESYYCCPNCNKSTKEPMGGEYENCQTCGEYRESKQITKPTCGHSINEYTGLVNTPVDNETKPKRIGYKWVLETMEQYFDRWKNEAWVPLEVEHVRKKLLYEDDNIRILWKAKLDLLTDTLKGIFPCDHKTMSQKRSTISMNNQFMGQCLVTDSRSVIIDKIGFQTSLKPEEKFIRPMVSYSAERLIEWQSQTLPHYAYELLEYNETGYWPQRLTHCENKYGTCQFLKVCESNPDMREEELRKNFIIGEVWDPINTESDDSEDAKI